MGKNGMQTVCRATETKLNWDMALKILPERAASDSLRMVRFQREAEGLAPWTTQYLAVGTGTN